MGIWEANGKSSDWYTPKYVFDALGETFDFDVAHPPAPTFVPALRFYSNDSLDRDWFGFIWMNPPFGGRNGLTPWLNKFFDHGNGIALTPDRTSAPWWQQAASRADAVLFVNGKIKFIRPDGSLGKSPGNGTTLFASGDKGGQALRRAAQNGLGTFADLRAEAAE